jgi:hypothetical protein
VASAKFFKSGWTRRRAGGNGLETLGVGHLCDVNDDISRRLRLRVQPLNRESANCDTRARKRCIVIPLFYLIGAEHARMSAPTFSIANANDIRVAAISAFQVAILPR